MSVLVFFVIVIPLFFLILPIKVKAKASFNVLRNKGRIKFYFFKLNFLTLNFKVKKKYILFTTKKGKSLVVPLEFGPQADLEYIDLTILLIDKTVINTIKINADIGINNDPFKTAILYGFIQTISSILLGLIKTKKLSTIVSNNINPVYTKNIAQVNISSSLTVCLIDYLWAIMQYIIKFKRVGKKYETR